MAINQIIPNCQKYELIIQYKMSDFSQKTKNRQRGRNQENRTFKSNIFDQRNLPNPNIKEIQQTNDQSLNSVSSPYFSPITTKPTIKPENLKTASKPMFSSSMFGVESKFWGGSLFQMARTVEERNDNINIEAEKEKNKYSFLQVPKYSTKNSTEGGNSEFKRIGSSMMFKQAGFMKTPSFLKKDSKSNADSNEQRPEGIFKKPENNQSTSKKTEFSKTPQASEKKTLQSNKNSPPDTFSPILMREKIISNSPINSSDSKNQSTNQPKESSSNNTLLDPKLIPFKGGRKELFTFQNQKKFYTPTEKNSAKLGLTNFIETAEKYNSTYNGTLKSQNKGSIFEAQQQLTTKLVSPNAKEGQNKAQIPSFIKFKQKRNLLQRNQAEKSKAYTNLGTASQQKQNCWKIQNFEIKDRLGKGAFGDVFLARQKKSGFFCVLKKLSKKKIKQQNTQQLIMRQIKIQSFLVHRHITNLYGFFDDEDFIYLIMEYMSDGSVAQRFNRRKVPQKVVASIVKQICDGLKYMHIENIIHRDIKPDNVFIHEDYIKLGDFGCSVFSDSKRNTMVGSLAYFSPQQLKNESYDEKIDIWSVGILCFELLTGKSPFEEDIMKIARKQKEVILSDLRFPNEVQLSEEAKEFTCRLLQETPQNRLTIMETLKHPFIVKNNILENIISSAQVGI